MKSDALKALVALARTQEDRIAAQLRDVQAKLQRAEQLRLQLDDFGLEYRHAALDNGRSGGQLGFVSDALAFGQRLHRTAAEQVGAIADHRARREEVQRALVLAQHRVQAIQKVLDKALRVERVAVERRQQIEVEDMISARLNQKAGMDRAAQNGPKRA